MEIVSIKTYQSAKMLSEAAMKIYGTSTGTLAWYDLLDDMENPKFDWVWDESNG